MLYTTRKFTIFSHTKVLFTKYIEILTHNCPSLTCYVVIQGQDHKNIWRQQVYTKYIYCKYVVEKLETIFSTRCRKMRAESLVFSYIRVKKLRSTLKFWLEKLICIFFHSFHSWKKTANQLFSSKYQCRK